MDHHEETEIDETDPSEQGSGNRPQTPAEGTSPPGSDGIDSEQVERVREQLKETGAN